MFVRESFGGSENRSDVSVVMSSAAALCKIDVQMTMKMET